MPGSTQRPEGSVDKRVVSARGRRVTRTQAIFKHTVTPGHSPASPGVPCCRTCQVLWRQAACKSMLVARRASAMPRRAGYEHMSGEQHSACRKRSTRKMMPWQHQHLLALKRPLMALTCPGKMEISLVSMLVVTVRLNLQKERKKKRSHHQTSFFSFFLFFSSLFFICSPLPAALLLSPKHGGYTLHQQLR